MRFERSKRRAPGPVLAAVLMLTAASFGPPAAAGAVPVEANGSVYEAHIAEAAAQFDLPRRWIALVLQAESGGDPRAVSRAGAIGLMQIMPPTWEELRRRHGLGDDPFQPRDNIIAGAAYMRELFDRFGFPGFLAAYNAGPARYETHLRSGRALPAETRAYLARLAPLLAVSGSDPVSRTDIDPLAWTSAPLFAAPAPAPRTDPGPAASQTRRSPPDGLFPGRGGEGAEPRDRGGFLRQRGASKRNREEQ